MPFKKKYAPLTYGQATCVVDSFVDKQQPVAIYSINSPHILHTVTQVGKEGLMVNWSKYSTKLISYADLIYKWRWANGEFIRTSLEDTPQDSDYTGPDTENTGHLTPDEIIKVVQAYKDGKKIQIASIDVNNWQDCPEPTWDFFCFRYRVKPRLVRWRAEEGKSYITINKYGETSAEREDNLPQDDKLWSVGNYFRTSHEAEEAAEKIRAIFRANAESSIISED